MENTNEEKRRLTFRVSKEIVEEAKRKNKINPPSNWEIHGHGC